MKIVWTTDPHLDHAPVFAFEKWVDQVLSFATGAVVITGDISEAEDVVFQLRRMTETFGLPVYFVLGNHDFYGRTIAQTRREVIEVCREDPLLFYLTDCGPVDLGDGVFLVGEDGWGDATVGDFAGSAVRLRDFDCILDFANTDPSQWQRMLTQLGAESAERLAVKLHAVPDTAREVLIATHLPPWREACWYQGQISDDHWAPFFVCGQVGEMLDRAAKERPQRAHTVLCGHTHFPGRCDRSQNLVAHTGIASYGQPTPTGMIDTSTKPLNVRTR